MDKSWKWGDPLDQAPEWLRMIVRGTETPGGLPLKELKKPQFIMPFKPHYLSTKNEEIGISLINYEKLR